MEDRKNETAAQAENMAADAAREGPAGDAPQGKAGTDAFLGMGAGRIAALLLSGILIGGGAILPGISGGVLCVVFGIYQPMMELLSHPLKAAPKYWRMLLPVGIGWLLGFFGFARVIELIFGANEILGTWLFIGLIVGTLPSLWQEAGTQGRSARSWISAAAAFLLLFGTLLFVRLGTFQAVQPSFGAFVFCGVLWGLSLIVPGMSSSSILMSLGLLIPLTSGIADFSVSVMVPWAIGLAVTVLALARLVNHLFQTYYSFAYHAVVGVTVASTLIIIPLTYAGLGIALLSALCFAVGLVVAYFLGKLDSVKKD